MSSFLTGKISEKTVYVPVPANRYRFKVVHAEIVDPVTLGWIKDGAQLSDEQRAFREALFGRMRCQILSDAVGTPVIHAGRMVECQVRLQPGVNPSTGRSNLETMADILRLRAGLKAKDEVVGHTLFETEDLEEMFHTARALAVTELSRRFSEAVLHLEFVGIVGEVREEGRQERIVKIVVPK